MDTERRVSLSTTEIKKASASLRHVRPKFDRPPIVEQAITVVFEELPGFSIGHYGLFWSQIKTAFPVCEHLSPLKAMVEELPARAPKEQLEVLLQEQMPLPRALFRHSLGGEVIQVQNNRFTFNWALLGDTEYPHFEITIGRFRELFDQFGAFVAEQGLGPIRLLQCELTNVNIVPVEEFGSAYSDASAAFNLPEFDVPTEILRTETYISNVQYLIYDQDEPIGRLHAVLQPVIKSVDQSPAYRLELTARSGRGSGDVADALVFFDFARSAINSAFIALTTAPMREKWGLQNG
jgi:uncharacterized protein (TIGR04255 family)